MAYIGNTADQQAFTPAVDFFSGNGVTTAFTLSRPVASVAQVQATIENVPQNPGTAFTVSGNTITFDGAPASGTNNIYVYYTSPITQVIQPGQGTVGTAQMQSGVITPTAISDQLNASTGYFDLPTGTTAQRPSSPVNGMTRYNTTINQFEVYQNSAWTSYLTIYPIEYVIIAGGGSGNNGGGGAGGYRSSVAGESSGGGASAETALPLIQGTAYTVTVGAGGTVGSNGSNSVFGSITSTGGGFSPYLNAAGSAGGSGGGGGLTSSASGTFAGGAGTAGQGFAGGSSNRVNPNYSGGGGGGAGSVGSNGSPSNPGNGGSGVSSSIDGTATIRAVGGRGYADPGGVFGTGTNIPSANTGSGGGAAPATGIAGGSGVVIIRYPGAQRGTGGTVTSSGGFTIHTFTTSGTYTA